MEPFFWWGELRRGQKCSPQNPPEQLYLFLRPWWSTLDPEDFPTLEPIPRYALEAAAFGMDVWSDFFANPYKTVVKLVKRWLF